MKQVSDVRCKGLMIMRLDQCGLHVDELSGRRLIEVITGGRHNEAKSETYINSKIKEVGPKCLILNVRSN